MTDLLERARNRSPYLAGSSAERLIDELIAEVERLTADLMTARSELESLLAAIRQAYDGIRAEQSRRENKP